MHGTLRLFLATLVVLSHLNHEFGAVNSGAPAVIVFYMLAGYVVTNLCQKFFRRGGNQLAAFYAERFLRIYPLYFFLLLLTSIFLFATGFGHPSLNIRNVVANLTIIPLNYFHFADFTVVADKHLCILPTGWSLGAEMQAYLVLPLIIRSTNAKWICGVLSLGIFSLAAAGILSPDPWAYYLVPGILFLFLTGSAVCKTLKHPAACDAFDRHFPHAVWAWILFLLVAQGLTHRLQILVVAVALGILIGLPILIFTSRAKLRLPLDATLGQLSYGIFLIHFPALWLLEYLFPTIHTDSKAAFVFILSVSLIVSAISTFTVERLVWPLRKKLTAGNVENSPPQKAFESLPIFPINVGK